VGWSRVRAGDRFSGRRLLRRCRRRRGGMGGEGRHIGAVSVRSDGSPPPSGSNQGRLQIPPWGSNEGPAQRTPLPPPPHPPESNQGQSQQARTLRGSDGGPTVKKAGVQDPPADALSKPESYFELLVDKDPGSRVQRPEQKIGLAFGTTVKPWDPDQQHST